jgi:formylmethanofuran dehydrogenase subunit C
VSGYTLTWKRKDGPAPADGSVLRPDTLGALDRDAFAATCMSIGRTLVPLGELFDIEPLPDEKVEPGPSPLLVLRGLPIMDRLGAGMGAGDLVIEGDAGDDLGASMSGGAIHVHGSAGHRVGGPAYASRRGMTGGEVFIEGDAGDHAGFLMRRGLIAVAGRCGASPGYRMLAGTVVVGTGPVDHPGLELRRGTVICLDAHAKVEVADAFAPAGEFDAAALPIVALVARRLIEASPAWKLPGRAKGRVRLWAGDRFELNRGEVVQWDFQA